MSKGGRSGLLCTIALAVVAAGVFPANASVPPPTPKLDCRTGGGSYFWGHVKILRERRYWTDSGVWAGQQDGGSGRLKPLRRRWFKVETGPMHGMKGRWFYLRPGKIAIRFTFGGSSTFNDVTCAKP